VDTENLIVGNRETDDGGKKDRKGGGRGGDKKCRPTRWIRRRRLLLGVFCFCIIKHSRLDVRERNLKIINKLIFIKRPK